MGDRGGLAPKGSLREKPLGVKVKYQTYILKSLTSGKHYYGSTGNLDLRIKAHNSGKVRSTKSGRPWVLHYSEVFETKTESLKRENYFKSIDGYNFLKSAGISKNSYFCRGEMAEWSIAAVLKTVGCNSPGGSNPSLSADNKSKIA